MHAFMSVFVDHCFILSFHASSLLDIICVCIFKFLFDNFFIIIGWLVGICRYMYNEHNKFEVCCGGSIYTVCSPSSLGDISCDLLLLDNFDKPLY